MTNQQKNNMPKTQSRKQICLPPNLHADLKATARANGRTIVGQIQHWLNTQPIYDKVK